MNLTKTNWPLGWTPSADAVNGDPNGLLRADNICFDKTGAAQLVDGHEQVSSSFSQPVFALYTKIINNIEYIWSAIGNPVSDVQRSQGFSNGVSLLSPSVGNPSNQACFGDGLGAVLCCAGGFRVKDNLVNPLPLGLITPGPPNVALNNQQTITIPSPSTTLYGTSGINPSTVSPVDATATLVSPSNQLYDTTAIGGVPSTDIGFDIISFPFAVLYQPSVASTNLLVSDITSVEIDFLLDGNVQDPTTYQNYYSLVFPSSTFAQTPFLQVQNTYANGQTTLSANRWQAQRIGTDQTKDWTKVIGIRLVVNASILGVQIQAGDITFTGGASGPNGSYIYAQIDVNNNGIYTAKSPISVGTNALNLINGTATLTPYTNVSGVNQVTEHWFYRKSAVSLTVDQTTGQSTNASLLGDQYYFVGKSSYGVPFLDQLTDTQLLQLNIDGSSLPNLYLSTLNTNDGTNGLKDNILSMEGMYNERMLYMGTNFLYLSDRLNPDAIDNRYTLKPSGDPSEKNLFLKKLTNNVLILGTTKDLYEISGTLLDLPDGTVDANLIKLGEAYPPLSVDVTNFNGGIYYIAADGLRVTQGSNSQMVTPHLRQLFTEVLASQQTGFVARHGVPGVAIYEGVGQDYSVAQGHGKIYMALPLQDGTRRVFVWDTITNTGYCLYTNPIKLFSTQAGEVLASYGNPTNAIWALEVLSGFGAGGQGLPLLLRTVFDSNNQPRNRKDTFILKLIMDTRGAQVSVDIQKDGLGVTVLDETQWVNLGQYSANGQQTIYITLGFDPRIPLGFRYAVQISSTLSGVSVFKLYEMTIEYEARPEQVNYLRLLPTNLGTYCRKRITAFAFVIDTLGNNVLFNPVLDGVPWFSQTTQVAVLNTGNPLVPTSGWPATKQTYIFYFQSEAIATDLGGLLVAGTVNNQGVVSSSGCFEFYGLALDEIVSEKMPHPTEFLVIPADNYGTPNRKRHTSYKFQINTRGSNVTFTPILDGVKYASAIFNTTIKQTVIYYFTPGDVIGIDIGGTLSSTQGPFEFYGVVVPQTIEKLPDELEYFVIPNSNFGSPVRKRLRTIPLVIDTHNQNVQYTPYVDGQAQTPSIFNTNGKFTVFHFFQTDVFGVDFGGTLQSLTNIPFEFYGMEQPEDVEILPVPKKFDQLGPVRFDKIGKLFGWRLHLLMTGSTISLPWSIYDDVSNNYTNPLISGNLSVSPNIDSVYEVQLPKSVNLTIARLVLGPSSDYFHRFDVQMKVQDSGMQGQSQWRQVR